MKLQMIIDEGGNESEGTKQIMEKERELIELKEKAKVRRSSRERSLDDVKKRFYEVHRYSTPDGRLEYADIVDKAQTFSKVYKS